MIKVYQTHFGITEKPRGNCMQAALASLLELPLEKVPHFMEVPFWKECYKKFLITNGYKSKMKVNNPNIVSFPYLKFSGMVFEMDLFPEIVEDDTFNGLFYATVYSPAHINIDRLKVDENYNPPTHAVIIDKNFNIIHDPNPKYAGLEKYPLADEIGYNGIAYIHLIKKS